MSCPKTEHLMQEYFADDLAPRVREEVQAHINECESCSAELEFLLMAKNNLGQWEEQRVPHWDRGMELYRREHGVAKTEYSFWNKLQWLPTAASFAMLAVLLLNVSFVSSGDGYSISFGASGRGEAQTNLMNSQLLAFEQEQEEVLDDFIQRMEDRQDSNNVELLQAVMDQTQQTTAENLERIYAFFEQQRLQDLEDMRVSYQYLEDSDYATIRSLQEIAQFVSYQGDIR